MGDIIIFTLPQAPLESVVAEVQGTLMEGYFVLTIKEPEHEPVRVVCNTKKMLHEELALLADEAELRGFAFVVEDNSTTQKVMFHINDNKPLSQK